MLKLIKFILLLGIALLGAVLGVASSLLLMARVHRENQRLRRQARLVSEEVNNLRTIPVKDR